MSDIFSFDENDKTISLRYDLSQSFSRFYSHKLSTTYQINYKRYQIKYLEMRKPGNAIQGNLFK